MKSAPEMSQLLCPLRDSLTVLGGKWKLPIICILSDGQAKRYSQIKRCIPEITNMMLSQSLKEMEADGLLYRRQYNEVPPRVEYTLSETAMELRAPLTMLADWQRQRMADRGLSGPPACSYLCHKEPQQQ